MIRLAPQSPPEVVPIYDYTSTIREKRVRVRMVWFDRRRAWYLDLWVDGVLQIQGRRMAAGQPLVWRFRFSPELPLEVTGGRIRYGRIALLSVSGDHSECLQDGLGYTHILYWVDPDDQLEPVPTVVEVS